MSESWWLVFAGLCGYFTAAMIAWSKRSQGVRFIPVLFVTLIAAVATQTAAIVVRWMNTGYGPFLTLHEVLLSNSFSLGLIVLIAYRWVPQVRPGIRYCLLVIMLLTLWALSVPIDAGRLPATFDSPWLWFHVGFGKIFLGMMLLALGMSIAGLISDEYQDAGVIDVIVWRFAGLAFVFDSAMLLTGAVWANDAWGRYWNWDPVETWALVTWLVLGLCIHARLTWKMPLRIGWLMIVGVFVLAFLTLFGMPFISLGPHKGIL